MMRFISNDKYTIAWFKLAECVAKGEKEKAFGMYLLLKHSLEDQAYATQLEGDLLHAFDDKRSIEKYAYAAQLYQNNHRYKEAALLYQELIFLAPEDDKFIIKLLDICQKQMILFSHTLEKIIQKLVEQKRFLHASLFMSEIEAKCNSNQVGHFYLSIIQGLSLQAGQHTQILESMVRSAITYFCTACPVANELQVFLSALETVDYNLHQEAVSWLEQNRS